MNETKLHILTTSFKLFLCKNFKEVTMQEIVTNTGLSKGAFYHYFKSKEQLFSEVIEMFFLTIPLSQQKKIDSSSLFSFYHDYLENASQTYAQLGEIVKEANVNIISVFSLSLDAMKRLPNYKEKYIMGNKFVLGMWINVIKSARENGEISTSMTDVQIAYFFKFTMEGMGMKSEQDGISSAQNDKELIELWDNFYEQIKTKI